MYGQLSQLVGFDPTPRDIACEISPRTISWVSIMSDLSGLHDKGGIGKFFGVDNNNDTNDEINYFNDNSGWIDIDKVPNTLLDIFNEIGRVYIPCLIANSKAFNNGDTVWETKIDNSVWKQKTFPYQAKCLSWIKDEFNKLSKSDKEITLKMLKGSGCEKILN